MGKTLIGYVLDSSGSMGTVIDAVPQMFNQYIDDQKKVKGKARLTLTVFDTRFETPLENAKLKDVPRMVPAPGFGYARPARWNAFGAVVPPPVPTPAPDIPLTLEGLMPLYQDQLVFRPANGTALLDGIGITIEKLEAVAKPDDKVLVVIHTDGYENSSEKYTYEQINERIKALDTEDSNWTFVFLGAGLDAAAEGFKLGVQPASTFGHAHNASGYSAAAQSLIVNTTTLRSSPESKLLAYVDPATGKSQVKNKSGLDKAEKV